MITVWCLSIALKDVAVNQLAIVEVIEGLKKIFWKDLKWISTCSLHQALATVT